MRTDITIDRKQVRLPGASFIGHQKWKAQFGDIVFFRQSQDNPTHTVGRVIGRIARGRHDYTTGKNLKDWLVVICLGSNLSFAMERWVDPANVTECYAPDSLHLGKRLAYFFGKEWLDKPTDELRKLAEDGDFFSASLCLIS